MPDSTESATGSTAPPPLAQPAAALSPVLFLVALVAYIALGYALKSVVLNWVLGPLFPLITLYLVPAAVRQIVGRGRIVARGRRS